MRIWVDADAFPNALKEVLMRAVLKRHIPTLFVANKKIALPEVDWVAMHIVGQGADIADNYIAQSCASGDLVITADIPLADRVVERGAFALDPRGTRYTPDNIKQILAMRNLMENLRNAGEITGGPSAIGPKEVRSFANALNVLLSPIDFSSSSTLR